MSPLMVSISGVRGIVGPDFNAGVVSNWSAAFSDLIGPGPIVVGRDSRPSGEGFVGTACEVFSARGREIWDLGIVPTPTVQIAVETWKAAGGLILTASHNPSEWNACKFVGPDGAFLSPDRFRALRERVESGPGEPAAGEKGTVSNRGEDALALHAGIVARLIDKRLTKECAPKVLLECIHGAAGVLLPRLLRDLGAELTVLHEEPSGLFPRDPEPSGPPLDELAVEAERIGADFAIAVDPDVDRCAVAVPGTSVIGEEWTLPLVAAHLLEQRKGTVVTNLSSSTRLETVAEIHRCTVKRAPVGEANVVGMMRATNAVLGGEGNGGVIDPQAHYGRDAAVAAAWLLQAHASTPGGLASLASGIPHRYLLKGKMPIEKSEGETGILNSLRPILGEPDDRSDGLRWTRDGGFVHVRLSATEPIMRIIVEGPSRREAESIFAELIEAGSSRQ